MSNSHEGNSLTQDGTTMTSPNTELTSREEESAIVTRNFELKNVTYPATVLQFNKNQNHIVADVITFSSAEQLVYFLSNAMGAFRLVTGQVQELSDVPTPTLLVLFNRTRGDKPLDRFRDRKSAEARTAEVIMSLAVKFEETQMAEAQKTADTSAQDAEAKAKAKADAKAKKDAAKAQEKEKKAKELAAKRADGVIGTIKSFLESKSGATVAEVIEALVKKFPNRTRDGMLSTTKIQFSRLAKSTKRTIVNKEIKDRGRVYKFEDKGPIPGKEVVKTAPTPETPAPRKGRKNAANATAPATETPATPPAPPAPPAAETPVTPIASAKGKGKK